MVKTPQNTPKQSFSGKLVPDAVLYGDWVWSGFEYTSFGSGIKERTASFTIKYRFGFNNQEQETELGEYYSFEYRVHDARLGRFLSVDPLAPEYPWNSTYAFAENRVLDGKDLEGQEWQPVGKDNQPLREGDKNIAGYKWVGYDRKVGFQNANTGEQSVTWVPKPGTLANPPPITLGNYTYNWSSDPNTRSGTVQMTWNGGNKNPSRPLDGSNIEIQINQQDNGESHAKYRSYAPVVPGAPRSVVQAMSENTWKELKSATRHTGTGSFTTFSNLNVNGMRASQLALRANNQEDPYYPLLVTPDKTVSYIRNEGLEDGAEPFYYVSGAGGLIKGGAKVLFRFGAKQLGKEAAKTGAKLSTNGIKLAKQLASEAQMAENGITVIGPGKLKEANRLAQQYGGNASEWVKKSSSSFAKNGTTFETHWYENISTGVRAEFKTKIP